MTMLAPCRASSRTIDWPIPLLPPVTMATLFFNDMIVLLNSSLGPTITHYNALRQFLRRQIDDLCRKRRNRRCGRGFQDLTRLVGWLRRRSLQRQLVDQVRDQPGPASLMRSTTPAPVVTMKILLKQDVVLEVRVGLEFLALSKDRPPAVSPTSKQLHQTAAQFIGDFVERQHHTRASRTLDC